MLTETLEIPVWVPYNEIRFIFKVILFQTFYISKALILNKFEDIVNFKKYNVDPLVVYPEKNLLE